jgi:peptidoglycan/LPS O-acetylase OafA/YrhL
MPRKPPPPAPRKGPRKPLPAELAGDAIAHADEGPGGKVGMTRQQAEALAARTLNAMTAERFYVPQLDGLRFFAFLVVFIAHVGAQSAAPPWLKAILPAGGFGVDLFFVLSSFLITTLLQREQGAQGRIDVRAFWMRRILRIWPLYFFFLWTVSALERPGWGYFVASSLFLGNWALALRGWGNPQPVTSGLWSVAVEEQFYLTWPVILQWTPRRRLPWICGGLIVVAMMTRAVVTRTPGSSAALWCNTLARLDPIAIGALVALFVAGPGRRWALPVWAHLGILAASASAVVAVVTMISWHVIGYLLVAVVLGGAVLATVLAPREGPLAHPVLVYLGRISYGLYVYHFPALWLAEHLEVRWWAYHLPLVATLTLGAAACSYRLLEQPFLRLKERFTYVRSAPGAYSP